MFLKQVCDCTKKPVQTRVHTNRTLAFFLFLSAFTFCHHISIVLVSKRNDETKIEAIHLTVVEEGLLSGIIYVLELKANTFHNHLLDMVAVANDL